MLLPLIVIILAALYVLIFEFINGFHDTANAVATVIYTRSLKPRLAVMRSGMRNTIGVLLGGTTVALGIAHILPLEILSTASFADKIVYFFALMLSAIMRNIYTRYKGIPSSSMHALIGSVIGTSGGMVMHMMHQDHTDISLAVLPWHKLGDIGLSLLISPLVGGLVSFALIWILIRVFHSRVIQQIPSHEPPPYWIRAILITTCTAVSFSHGANDGQKGIGIMIALLSLTLPQQFTFGGVPWWIIGLIGATIGMGTMIGWKRIVKTLGEKIGKHHMTYAQGAAAEIVAAGTIALSTYAGLPVSTTHVLSSGIAGSMIATGGLQNLQKGTVHNIIMAWVLTLPVTIVLGFILYRMSLLYMSLFS